MNDRKWLADFWKYPDKMQGVLLQYISRLDLADSVGQVFDRFNKTAPILSVREVTRLHEHLQDQNFAEAQQLKRRRNINRNEAVACYIIAELLERYRLITAKAEQTFTDIANDKYGGAVPFSVKKQMNEPMTNGKILQNELLGNARYRARQLTDYYTMQRSYDKPPSADDPQVADILKADKNSLLRAAKIGYIGLYDQLMTNIVGHTTLQFFIDKGVKRVEFVAVMDDRTTDRCAQLNGTRWYVSQLRLGYNVPPITEESIPHPCRSALRAVEMEQNHAEAFGDAGDRGIMEEDIQIGRSVGAASKNYEVLLPNGFISAIAEGTRITKIVTFAGKGTTKLIREASTLSKKYNVPESEWKKVRGDAYVMFEGKPKHAEIHWYESEKTDKIKMKVKRWFE